MKIPPERLVEVERRVLLVEHAPSIERELSKRWGITRRQVRKYIAIVRGRLVEAFKSTTPEEHATKAAGMLDEAYRIALADRDPKAMVACAKTYAEITGVKAPTKVDVTSGGAPLAAVVLLPALDDDATSHGSVPAEPGPADPIPLE